jgi:hypothetical protein
METQRRVVDAKHCAQRAGRKSSFEHHRDGAPSVGGLSAASSGPSPQRSRGAGSSSRTKVRAPANSAADDPALRANHPRPEGTGPASCPARPLRRHETASGVIAQAQRRGPDRSLKRLSAMTSMNSGAHRFVTFSYWRDDLPIHRARDLLWLGNINFNQGACEQAERAHLRPRALSMRSNRTCLCRPNARARDDQAVPRWAASTRHGDYNSLIWAVEALPSHCAYVRNHSVRAGQAWPGSAGVPRRSAGSGCHRSKQPGAWDRGLRRRGRAHPHCGRRTRHRRACGARSPGRCCRAR